MTFLYFVLDTCFYNYTFFKTDFLLHTLLEKKHTKIFYFLSILAIDILLFTKGKIFLLYTILYFLNKKIKFSYQNIHGIFFRFFFLYFFYKIGIFLLFQNFNFDIFGFLISLLVLFICHKKF